MICLPLQSPMDYLPGYENPCWMSSITPLPLPPLGRSGKRRWGANKTPRTGGAEPELRCLPGVYQIGAAGSGTTDLHKVVSTTRSILLATT